MTAQQRTPASLGPWIVEFRCRHCDEVWSVPGGTGPTEHIEEGDDECECGRQGEFWSARRDPMDTEG